MKKAIMGAALAGALDALRLVFGLRGWQLALRAH